MGKETQLRALSRAGITAMLLCAAVPAIAGDYPNRPIRLLVPGTAGGGMDVMARLVANSISDEIKEPIVVENKPGAAGDIAIGQLARSPADGYTIALGQTSQLAINPTLYGNLPYDPTKDLAPIALLSEAPNVVIVSAKSPIKTIADLIAKAKAASDGLDLATPGVGTVSHLAAEMLQKQAAIKFHHIPYKGASSALRDVIGGRVPVMMSSIPTALALIKAGELRALAVTAAKRNPVLPDVPTMEEQGYPHFYAATWYGLLLPAGTPKDVVAKLNKAANQALDSGTIKTRVMAEGGTVLGGSSEAFESRIVSENLKWSRLIKEAGIKLK
jgi:tripartite-type tricarboxylate transporter receptor subunit TctC